MSQSNNTLVGHDLTEDEKAEFQTHTETIRGGLQSFVDVGRALVAIRDGRLYRGSYSTFEKYLKAEWQLGRAYAHRIMQAAEAMDDDLSPIGNVMPSNEAQVRPLLRLPKEERASAWNDARALSLDGKPTAREVEKAVAMRLGAATEGEMPVVDPEFAQLLPPTRDCYRKALRESIRERGCIVPLYVWAETGLLLDGHLRLQICQELRVGFEIKTFSFTNREDAMNFIRDRWLFPRGFTSSAWAEAVEPGCPLETTYCVCGKLRSEHGDDVARCDGKEFVFKHFGAAPGCDGFTPAE